MAYSDFTLDQVQKTFHLTISQGVDIFSPIPEVESSEFLTEILRYNTPLALAINTVKSRSEMIID